MKILKVFIIIMILALLSIMYSVRINTFHLEKIVLLIPVYLIYIVAPLMVILNITIKKMMNRTV